MPILNRVAEIADEVAGWRRQLHAKPELDFDLKETASFVAEKLRSFGVDRIETGIARTGLVGVIHGRNPDGPAIGLRADMDALPIEEQSGKPWASQHSGRMHACGHDGHTAMLLGAARHLAETRNFRGSVALIFQPAEEGGGGARVMLEEGLMERFNVEKVFGMHNMPGLPVGEFAIRPGPIMASTAEFSILVKGKGTHAAMPHKGIDPILAASQMVSALQSVVSRSTDANDALVLSVTRFHSGSAHNIIPDEALLGGTCRFFEPQIGELARERMERLVESTAAAFGADAVLNYKPNYPATVNHPEETVRAGNVAALIAGEGKVDRNVARMLGGEDFSYMLQQRPGAFIFLGNGDTANLHHPAYDFNDEAIPYGISYWVKLVETELQA